jgi:urease alpha subunit
MSKASLDAGVPSNLGLQRRTEAVKDTRSLSKRDMLRNDALPRIEVDPETYVVKVDGEVATCPPAQTLPLAQKYFLV